MRLQLHLYGLPDLKPHLHVSKMMYCINCVGVINCSGLCLLQKSSRSPTLHHGRTTHVYCVIYFKCSKIEKDCSLLFIPKVGNPKLDCFWVCRCCLQVVFLVQRSKHDLRSVEVISSCK